MEDKGFTHLHVHSEYSLLDGACQVKKLVKTAGELGMTSLALTDHGNMFGALTFYSACVAAGIKPIIGTEAYIAPGSRKDREAKGIGEAAYHLILLAQNRTGYHNLLKLASSAYLEGFYYRPRIDREILSQHSEGLICCSACLAGELPTFLAKGERDKAVEAALYYKKLFGPDRFYVEIQSHCADQNAVNPLLIELAHELDIPLVATNDVHFLREQDYEAHEVLTCLSTGKTFEDDNRLKYPRGLFLKSAQQMREMFPDCPEACDNTLKIADMCDLKLDFGQQHAPVYIPRTTRPPKNISKSFVSKA